MKNQAQKIQFQVLSSLFDRVRENLFVLPSAIGIGFFEFFGLSRGLETRFWNCRFNRDIEITGSSEPGNKNRFFTLICFLDTLGLRLSIGGSLLSKTVPWDTIFLSANSKYGILIPAQAERQCISISFTDTWFRQNVLKNNQGFQSLKQQIYEMETFSVLGTMRGSEQMLVKELLKGEWKQSFGIFYVKSVVLKIVSDILHRIRERGSLSINQHCLEKQIPSLQKYLK